MKTNRVEELRGLVGEINGLIEAAELGNEAHEAISNYYAPLEAAARNVIEAAGVRTDTTHVQVPMAAFNDLFRAIYGREPEETEGAK